MERDVLQASIDWSGFVPYAAALDRFKEWGQAIMISLPDTGERTACTVDDWHGALYRLALLASFLFGRLTLRPQNFPINIGVTYVLAPTSH